MRFSERLGKKVNENVRLHGIRLDVRCASGSSRSCEGIMLLSYSASRA